MQAQHRKSASYMRSRHADTGAPARHAPLATRRPAQVFDAFIRGFGAPYRPVLTAIRQQYDEAVRRGVACALDNLELRRQLLGSRGVQRRAAQEARARVMDGERAGGPLHHLLGGSVSSRSPLLCLQLSEGWLCQSTGV